MLAVDLLLSPDGAPVGQRRWIPRRLAVYTNRLWTLTPNAALLLLVDGGDAAQLRPLLDGVREHTQTHHPNCVEGWVVPLAPPLWSTTEWFLCATYKNSSGPNYEVDEEYIVPASLAPPLCVFLPEFELGGCNGGRSVGAPVVGRWRSSDGDAATHAVRKRIQLEHGDVHSLLVTWQRRVLPDRKTAGMANTYETIVRFLNQVKHPNLVRVLEVRRMHELSSTGAVIHSYTEWCNGGSAHDARIVAHWLGDDDCCAVLSGAWEGLRHLHNGLQLLHLDVKPANVFVHQATEVRGVLGDIDDAVVRTACEKLLEETNGGMVVQSTVCYGSPHRHCDPRRDQTAMLLTSVELLSRVSWHAFCEQQATGDDAALKRLGYDPPTTDLGMYAAYADAVKQRTRRVAWQETGGGSQTTPTKLHSSLAELLRWVRGGTWEYDELHSAVSQALTQLPQAKRSRDDDNNLASGPDAKRVNL